MKNQNSKIQNLLNFGKVKHGEMGNFISFPNLIFAKFYLRKKGVKTTFFLRFSMEKGLFAIFRNLQGVFWSLSFCLLLHEGKQAARRSWPPRHVLLASRTRG